MAKNDLPHRMECIEFDSISSNSKVIVEGFCEDQHRMPGNFDREISDDYEHISRSNCNILECYLVALANVSI